MEGRKIKREKNRRASVVAGFLGWVLLTGVYGEQAVKGQAEPSSPAEREPVVHQQRAGEARRTAKRRFLTAIAGGAGAMVLLGLGLRLAGRRRAQREHRRETGQAWAQQQALADRLTDVQRRLAIQPAAAARTKFEAAELAFFEALEALRPVEAGNLNDWARVHRAQRLLTEAEENLTAAEAQLAKAEAAAPSPPEKVWACFFCSRPLTDPYAGNCVELRAGGERRLVLCCLRCSQTYRRRGSPPVRVVRRGGKMLHWAQVATYDPFYDLYHDDRHGWEFAPVSELEGALFAPESCVLLFVEAAERPDFILRL
ncbi:MAG TPA: hypothetical protein EYP85_00050 [Armatimonadetes bacterium]|nr:hypothetical protein [Armatimonadota bacterium]